LHWLKLVNFQEHEDMLRRALAEIGEFSDEEESSGKSQENQELFNNSEFLILILGIASRF
jgi:hypothetical protein